MKKILLCDFDGTIVNIDTAEYILEHFTEENWQIYDKSYEKGEITLEESIKEQFKLINMPEKEIFRELEKVTFFRSNLHELVKYCKNNSIGFKIVSAGIDFIIKYFIQKIDDIEIYAAKTSYSENGLEVTFDRFKDPSSKDFKNDVVRYYKNMGYRIYFLGDGYSDYGAVLDADFTFVVKNSRLYDFCKRNNISHMEFLDFKEVINYLNQENLILNVK